MSYPYFKLGLRDRKGNGALYPRGSSTKAENIKTLDHSRKKDERDPDYHPNEDLAHAVNVALALGAPLLLTGEPGVGKTDLARVLGEELSCPVHPFDTQSTSEAKDLFYSYDSLMAFRKVDETDHRAFINYRALGLAILEAFGRSEVNQLLHPKLHKHEGPRRSIVLIDEIDKAPRDFPNDLLNQIDKLYFRIPELENRGTPIGDKGDTRIPADYRPIIVITSNSEKTLPEAFLRRCVYFNIDFPKEKEDLERIVVSHVDDIVQGSLLLGSAVGFFLKLRTMGNLQKKPSTAELLNWIEAMIRCDGDVDRGLEEQKEFLERTLCALVKTEDDRRLAKDFIKKKWLSSDPDAR
ncbi:MAG: AAA family ATPase [Geminicoccaceae bacterium]